MKMEETVPTIIVIKKRPIINPILSNKLNEVIPDFLKFPGSSF